MYDHLELIHVLTHVIIPFIFDREPLLVLLVLRILSKQMDEFIVDFNYHAVKALITEKTKQETTRRGILWMKLESRLESKNFGFLTRIKCKDTRVCIYNQLQFHLIKNFYKTKEQQNPMIMKHPLFNINTLPRQGLYTFASVYPGFNNALELHKSIVWRVRDYSLRFILNGWLGEIMTNEKHYTLLTDNEEELFNLITGYANIPYGLYIKHISTYVRYMDCHDLFIEYIRDIFDIQLSNYNNYCSRLCYLLFTSLIIDKDKTINELERIVNFVPDVILKLVERYNTERESSHYWNELKHNIRLLIKTNDQYD